MCQGKSYIFLLFTLRGPARQNRRGSTKKELNPLTYTVPANIEHSWASPYQLKPHIKCLIILPDTMSLSFNKKKGMLKAKANIDFRDTASIRTTLSYGTDSRVIRLKLK
jgi:hypothetical protein